MTVDVWPRSAGVFATGLTMVGLLTAGVSGEAKAAGADPVKYLRASVQTGGGQPSPRAPGTRILRFEDASVSDDGRFTVFSSTAADLVPGDKNTAWDVFLRDTVDDVTTRISVSSSGQEGTAQYFDSGSLKPSMSADGRYVVFESDAPNLVPGDTNLDEDVFLRDTAAGLTTRVSLTEDGKQISDGGEAPAISPDGRFVVFKSSGRLVAGDTDYDTDVYLRELATGHTVRITESYDGQPISFPPLGYEREFGDLSVTSGGRHVLFTSMAGNLVPGDSNEQTDVFVRDVAASRTVRASVADSGAQLSLFSSSPSMSADGRYVSFVSNTQPELGGLYAYVRDLEKKTTTLAGIPTGDSPGESWNTQSARISPDGRHVAFEFSSSPASRVTAIHLRDLDTRTSRLVTGSPTGGSVDGDSTLPKFSANGHHLVFTSKASNLVEGDTNDNEDIFVRLNVL